MTKIILVFIYFQTFVSCSAIHSSYGFEIDDNYYETKYKPTKIVRTKKTKKEQYIIKNIKRFSYDKEYNSSACIKMVFDFYGTKIDISTINWITGLPYGALINSTVSSFILFNDPNLGYKIICEAKSFKKRFFITNNKKKYINRIKYYISKNKPLIISLNRAILNNKDFFQPYCIVVTGYNSKGIYYYQPKNYSNFIINTEIETKYPEAPEFIKFKKFTKAVRSLTDGFKQYWNYNLILLEKSSKKNNINILKRNGKSLIGESYHTLSTGAMAIHKFANKINESEFNNNIINYLKRISKTAVYTRLDMSEYLAKKNKKWEKVYSNLKKSSLNFKKILRMIKNNRINKQIVVRLLRECSNLEKEAGKQLITLQKEKQE